MATAGDFLFVRSDEMFVGCAVSGGADTSYVDESLTDGRPGRPTRATNGSPSWTIVNGSAVTSSFVGVFNHNIDAARSITFGGDISKVIVGPTLPANGIPLNPFGTFSPTAATSVTLAISSNSATVVIGEVVIGKYRTLERNLSVRPSFNQKYQTVALDSEFDSLMPYDKGVISRSLSGSVILTDCGLADVQAWVDSTKGGSLMTVIVPLSNVQDAWAVKITDFSYQPSSANRNEVSLAFQEFPRIRW